MHVLIFTVSEIVSPEDEMQFWSNLANSVGRKEEKEKGTAFWYALEPLVKDFRQVLLCNLECRFPNCYQSYAYFCFSIILRNIAVSDPWIPYSWQMLMKYSNQHITY
jgi:hypothetical protein